MISNNDLAMQRDPANLDPATVRDFGREWRRFDQSGVSEEELTQLFDRYFAVFPWESVQP